ncbi:MAG: DinB family protein [Pyrinomonadaceae bacterium]|nr:DinB family protein [Phycisphaerales bacterium]
MATINLLDWWDDAWKEGLWYAAWPKAIQGLTPQQAAWTPAPGRKSIWEILSHMSFWREQSLRVIAGDPPSKEETAKRNFQAPTEVTPAAWQAARDRFAELQKQIRVVIVDPAGDVSRLQYMIPHDSYHMGQIMYLRALQGLPPIE